jgi:hypothetical protein
VLAADTNTAAFYPCGMQRSDFMNLWNPQPVKTQDGVSSASLVEEDDSSSQYQK